MEFNKEYFRKNVANVVFRDNLRKTIGQYTASVPQMSVLDYGAGALPLPFGPFGGLHQDQASVTSYDPSVNPYEFPEYDGLNLTRWVSEEPTGQQFDLVGCSFSLHHMQEPPRVVLNRLRQYAPTFIVIADYDYRGATVEDFQQTFISQAELNELEQTFGGDVEACYQFHSRLGLFDYQQALLDNGFMLTHTETGVEVAQYKFFTIGTNIVGL